MESVFESEVLVRRDDLVVRRGVHQRTGERVLVVTPMSEQPSLATLARLSHEYALRADLDVAWSAKPLSLSRESRRQQLVLVDPGAELLATEVGTPMELGRFLDLAVGAAAALRQMHAHGVIHRDLKPEHLLVDASSGRIWLTGFGQASCNPREQQAPLPADVIAGTFAYMAPEQTGRMNRSVDARSDLYSLGIVFHQLLAGELPFAASEPLEWVYCHIARQPPSLLLRRPALPPTLAALVTKLLAKNPEDRYQTATGLEADLQRCRAQWLSAARIEPFALASDDLSPHLLLPEGVYGRERESAQLRQAFQRMLGSGTPQLVLVSGYSGVGKSALVRELMKEGVAQRTLFLSGKYDQYKRDIPFATLAHAFGGLIRQILRQGEAHITAWREAVLAAVGRNGRLLTDLIPEAEWLIGVQPPVLELGPTEARNRFQALFRRFIGACATEQHPVVLFLDDLQWVDPASLALIENLVSQAEVRHLLLIGAYRDNEVEPTHRLSLALDRIIRAGARPEQIALRPLAFDALLRLVADAIRVEPPQATSLAAAVHERTGGNPLFALQLLGLLVEERLLWFDAAQRAWHWDASAIGARGFADNVVDLMLAKLQRLPPATLRLLEHLACLGAGADRATLALVGGCDPDTLAADLQEALRAGFVAPANDGFRFVHDRIQEAAYSLLPIASRPAVHLRIGRTLLANWSPETVEERCFELIDHFNRASALLAPGVERDRIAALNRSAGRKAKAAVAYAAARIYFSQARVLQPADAWTRHYEATFALQLELAECEFLAGQLERADELFDEALAAAVGDLDQARVLGLRMRTRQSTGRLSDALALGLQALALFGMHFPPSDEEAQRVFALEQAQFWRLLGTRRIADLEHLPVATDPTAQAMMSLLADAAACAYNARPLLTPLLYGRALNLALAHGNSPSTCMTYISYGSFSVARGDIPAAFAFAELGLRLNETFGDAKLRGTLLYVHGAHVNLWQRPLAESVPILEQGFTACQEVGNLVFAAFNAALLVSIVLESGEPLEEAGRIAHRYAGFAHEHRNEVIHPWMRLAEQLVANLQGRTRAPDSLEDDEFDEVQCLAAFARGNFHTGVANFHLTRSIACTFQRRGAAALAAAEACERVVRAVRSMPLEATHHFFHCLALCAAWAGADDEQRPAYRALLDTKLAQLEFWAAHCPANYANRLALVRAEVARIDGRALDAMAHYDAAISSARDHGFVQNEGLANQLAAEFHRSRGFDRIADAYLVDARYCYQRWGASALVATLDQSYPALAVERRDAGQRAQTKVEHLDLMSVLKASQAVSDDIVLDRLVQTLLRIASEHAGADRGLLLLPAGAEQRIVAQAIDHPDGMKVQLCDTRPGPAGLPESVLSYVLRTREKVLLDATSPVHAFVDDPYFSQHRPHSLLCLPLLKQSVLVGVLYLENQLIGGIFGARTQVLEMLASQAAISLENASLYANLQREQAAIRELNASLEQRVAERTLDLKLALREQQAILDNALTGIAFVRERRILRCNASFERLFGYAPGTLAGQPTRVLYETEAQYEAIEREIYPALRDNAGVFEDRELARRDGSRFWSTSHAKLVDPADPTQGLVWVLQDITARKHAEAALAEQSAAFERLARIDGLTGLFNRRHFDATARAAIAQCMERGEPVSAALLDLDHFKRINDHYSHATGDAVLKLAGELILAQLEAPAIAGRYGGEEFAVVFPGCDAVAAHAWCERLRLALAATDLSALHAELRVTLSAGVAPSSSGAVLERLLGEADRCLYQAKAEGRNRVCVA